MLQDSIDLKLNELLHKKHPSWAKFAEVARTLLPSGVAHDSRYTAGPTPAFTEGLGARKRDIDGAEFVDYWMGHGSLILGHSAPKVVDAVRETVGKLTHAGGCHPLEHKWARAIIELMPSVERVRFVMSGTEAAMLALRIARAYTTRKKVIKINGHFHGWSDFTLAGISPPFDTTSGGGASGILAETMVLPADIDVINEEVQKNNIACVILEPSGASGGAVGLPEGFLAELREVTKNTGTLLIFDEVITAFRLSTGGAQQKFGVMPDITTMGKIVAGGLPGAAVGGSAEVMEQVAFTGDKKRDKNTRVAHWGTFNANPISAASGIACLKEIATGRPIVRAENFAEKFRNKLNALFKTERVNWCAYGADSVLHIKLHAESCADANCTRAKCGLSAEELKLTRPIDVWLKKALWLGGVDWPGTKQAWTSEQHGEIELALTVDAFGNAIELLRSLGAEL